MALKKTKAYKKAILEFLVDVVTGAAAAIVLVALTLLIPGA
ncbi:hypothetical protein [Meiothermus rufus]|nr:hypothetical protein [Meiothermus rufus]